MCSVLGPAKASLMALGHIALSAGGSGSGVVLVPNCVILPLSLARFIHLDTPESPRLRQPGKLKSDVTGAAQYLPTKEEAKGREFARHFRRGRQKNERKRQACAAFDDSPNQDHIYRNAPFY